MKDIKVLKNILVEHAVMQGAQEIGVLISLAESIEEIESICSRKYPELYNQLAADSIIVALNRAKYSSIKSNNRIGFE